MCVCYIESHQLNFDLWFRVTNCIMSANRDHVHVADKSLFQDVDPTFWVQTLGPEIETCLPHTQAQTLKAWFVFSEDREENDHLARAHICAGSASGQF